MKTIHKLALFLLVVTLSVNGCTPQATAAATESSPTQTIPLPTRESGNTFFDDFNYVSPAEMTGHNWIVREKAGWPGVPGATFRAENVTFLEDTDIPGNRLLRMTSSTGGSAENTFQTQICHQRKYLEGTYAARVHFSNTPVSGPDGDQVVETFYAITPYEEALEPDYSEMDFEYLPNGGWGLPETTFMFTTWETVRIEPWLADNASQSIGENMDGWRTLVVQVGKGTVRYFVDGKQTAEHSGNYYPDAAMSINFNLWFINGGLLTSSETRLYQEDVDWVFHEANMILTPEQVDEKVQQLRESDTHFLDAVPTPSPELESLCDL